MLGLEKLMGFGIFEGRGGDSCFFCVISVEGW